MISVTPKIALLRNLMDKIKVSVTVPVYNTSKDLKQCIDSLKSQNFMDLEFIIVDDGSTDDSLFLSSQYTHGDQRFRIIHQNNGGLASARQTGLDTAVGEYVIVCDSDDWVEPDMYKTLYEKAKQTDADIVTCGYFTEYGEKGQKCNFSVFKETDGIVDNSDLVKRGAGWSWVKLVRRSLFKDYNITYEPGINLSEDSLIVYKLMKLNPKVVQIQKPLYHYRRVFGGTSYTNSLSMKHIRQLHFTYNWLKENYLDPEWRGVITNRAIDLAFACLRVSDLDKKFFKEFLRSELPLNKFIKEKISLKKMVVYSAKFLPLEWIKSVIKSFYPLVYS